MDYNILKKIILDLFKVDKINLPHADVLTFACDNDRYIDYLGKKYSPLIDTVTDDLESKGVSVVSITRIASRIKGDLSHGRVFSPEGAFARALILKRIKSLLLGGKKYPYSKSEEKIWDSILRKVQPKAVIGIMPSRELCTVCHRYGVWVADLQHGVISKKHPWYSPDFRAHEPDSWLPNVICWDDDAEFTIKSWNNKKVEIIKTGNPWINRFINGDESDKLLYVLKEKYPTLVDNRKSKILISVSWGCGDLGGNNFIPKALEEFILKNRDRYTFLFRLHPNMLQGFATHDGVGFFKYYNNVYKQHGIDWQQSTEMPLPLLLSSIDIHITWASSVCIEAAMMGKKTLTLNPKLLPGMENESYYKILAEHNYVTKGLPEYELIDGWVKENLQQKMKPYGFNGEEYDRLIKKIKEMPKVLYSHER